MGGIRADCAATDGRGVCVCVCAHVQDYNLCPERDFDDDRVRKGWGFAKL
jgi:hypothetical protein